MPFFHSRKEGGGKIRLELSEDFRRGDRALAEYFFALDGLELTGDALWNLLKEFSQREHPLLHLYLPQREGEMKARDFKIHKLKRNTISIWDLSLDGEAVSFMRQHSRVRFGFLHRNGFFLFETRILGKARDNEELLIVEKPKTIYRDRRNYLRYQLWPELQAFLGWMQVQEISWIGMGLFSDTLLEPREILENALLSLPPVYSIETRECLHRESKLQVPGAVVCYKVSLEMCFYYGLSFDQEFSDEQSEKLGDFLHALHKRLLEQRSRESFPSHE